jgi:hypothetical protein
MMALSPAKMDLLRKLALRHLTAIDLVSEARIRMVQDLVNAGYARDYADHKGHRIEVRLRIWGITAAGRAVLEQRDMVTTTTRQPALPIFQKTPLGAKARRPVVKLMKEKDPQEGKEAKE